MFSLNPLKTKILDYIRLHNITISALEKKLGLSNSAISKILMSESRSPSLETLIKLSKFLKFSLDELLDNKIVESKNTDCYISLNNDLFRKTVLYILFFVESHNIEITFENIQVIIADIYDKYNHENIEFSDKTYVDWYLKNYLLSNKD